MIPPEVKQAVVFIYVTNSKGERVPNGTGFLVGVPDQVARDRMWVYLVTAQHVIRERDTGPVLKQISVRINQKGTGVDYERIDLQEAGPGRNVFFHADSSVDLVAIPFLPNKDKYEFKFLPEQMLTAKDEVAGLNIREGAEVFFTGLLLQYTGEQRNYPVVRFGRVALMTTEAIEFAGARRDVYLLEVAAFGGNSGAPVFFSLGSDREPGKFIVGDPLLKLAGVMLGTFQDFQPVGFVQTGAVPFSRSNLGIAAVTPAYKLKELLHRPVVEVKRK